MFHESESNNKIFISRNERVGAVQIGCGSVPVTATVIGRELIGFMTDINGGTRVAINTLAEVHDGNRNYMIALPNSSIQLQNNKEVCIITSLVSPERAAKIDYSSVEIKPLAAGQTEALTPSPLSVAA